MDRISVKTTRRALCCLAAACFAITARAETIGVGAMPIAVSDALLASTRAANLPRDIVAHIPGAVPAAIAPVNATTTAANNVRLWDEVIPPAPSPKPTQASMSLPGPLPMTATVSHFSPPVLASGMRETSLKFNVNLGRMSFGAAR